MIGSSPTTSKTASPQQEYIHRAAWKAGVMGAMNVLSVLLAVRLILLVAVSGAIALAYLALSAPQPYTLGALAIYGGMVVIPLVYLASRR